MMKLVFSMVALASSVGWAHLQAPDSVQTPGVLCSSSDTDFQRYDYPEKIARCQRHIEEAEKLEVAAHYGNIPKSQWSKYEFDHLIPLCAGGSNNIANLWPQAIAQARSKDSLEVDICTRMKAGTLKQADAVEMVHKWFQSSQKGANQGPVSLVQRSDSPNSIHCVEKSSDTTSASPLSLELIDISESQIRDPRIMITENDNNSEVISLKGEVVGRLSRAAKPPLSGLFAFAVKDHQDRFEVYLPSERRGPFTAYLKLSFEDSFPKLTPLECQGSN